MHSQIDMAMKKDDNTPDTEYDAEYLRDLDEHLQQEEAAHTEYLD
jgi:DNA primase large subunit